MRILILNEYFYPDVAATAQHSSDLARALSRDGHQVTVVAGRRGYQMDSRQLLAPEEVWEGVRILRVSSLSLGKSARWRRALHFASLLLAYAWRLLWLRPHDVVLAMTTPPLMSLLATLFVRMKHGRLCLWMMDLNPDEAVAAGWLKRDGVLHRFLEILLRQSLRRADSIIVLDRFMQKRIEAKGVPARNMIVLPPWCHDEVVKYNVRGREEFRRKHRLEGKFVVMYSGNHSPCHPLTTLLEAAEELQSGASTGSPVVFCFIGGGSTFANVQEFARSKGLRNVVCLPYQPIELLGASLSAADLHVIVMGDPFVGIVHPSKIYNILRTGVPVLYIGPRKSHITEMLPPGEEPGWVHVFQHGDTQRVANCIQRCAYSGTTRHVQEETSIAESFSGGVLIPKFIQALTDVTMHAA